MYNVHSNIHYLIFGGEVWVICKKAWYLSYRNLFQIQNIAICETSALLFTERLFACVFAQTKSQEYVSMFPFNNQECSQIITMSALYTSCLCCAMVTINLWATVFLHIFYFKALSSSLGLKTFKPFLFVSHFLAV